MKAEANDLTTGVVWKKLLNFFFPILVGLLFQQLYNTADAVIVGHFLGDSALAAVGGSVSTIVNLVLGFFTGLNCGATVLISQYFGGNDPDKLSKALHSSAMFSIIVGITITILGFFGAPAALRIIKHPEDIMADSTKYLRIYLTGSVPLLMYNLFQGTYQAVGDSKQPLKYLIISCLINIVLDITFVGAFDWGVAGVGWASVISMLVCCLLALINLSKVNAPHRFDIKKLRLHFPTLKSYLRIGLPSGLQSSMYSISNLIIQAAVNMLGTDIAAAWTATSKLDGFYWVTTNAFGIAICSFAGQCFGAGKIDRMKKGTRTCLGISLGATIMLSVVLMSIARPAYRLFLKSDYVIDSAIEVMWYIVPFYAVWSYIEVLTGTLRGTGDTFIPMLIVMIGTCIFRVIWMFTVVPKWHTIPMISIVYFISWSITAIAFTIYFLRCRKREFQKVR